MTFTRPELQHAGFVGWLTFSDVRSRLDDVPQTPGVYVVSCETKAPLAFSATSCGGRFKGRDPTVTSEQLSANWVEDAEVVYIGKADKLRRRLKEFADFGAGKPIGHWGGRLIWQMPDVAKALVAWRPTPDRVARDVEIELIGSFRSAYGKPPFANDPHMWGR